MPLLHPWNSWRALRRRARGIELLLVLSIRKTASCHSESGSRLIAGIGFVRLLGKTSGLCTSSLVLFLVGLQRM
eukprot:1888086-Amphidinium_carterae.1